MHATAMVDCIIWWQTCVCVRMYAQKGFYLVKYVAAPLRSNLIWQHKVQGKKSALTRTDNDRLSQVAQLMSARGMPPPVTSACIATDPSRTTGPPWLARHGEELARALPRRSAGSDARVEVCFLSNVVLLVLPEQSRPGTDGNFTLHQPLEV